MRSCWVLNHNRLPKALGLKRSNSGRLVFFVGPKHQQTKKNHGKWGGESANRRLGVIESSLYQIMTGAILSVLGRGARLGPFLLLLLRIANSLAERRKSNDESNSITSRCSSPPKGHPWPPTTPHSLILAMAVAVVVPVPLTETLLRFSAHHPDAGGFDRRSKKVEFSTLKYLF